MGEQVFATLPPVRTRIAPEHLPTAARLASTEGHRVAPDLARLFPRGIPRGRSVWCGGDAAVTLAARLVAAATHDGAWVALVDLPDVGLLAACEQGVALERVVVARPSSEERRWAAVGAALDGFSIVVCPPPERDLRAPARLSARVHARGGVLVYVDQRGASAPFSPSPDVVVHSRTLDWLGIDDGAGHLSGRRVTVEVSGRRVPRPIRHVVELAG